VKSLLNQGKADLSALLKAPLQYRLSLLGEPEVWLLHRSELRRCELLPSITSARPADCSTKEYAELQKKPLEGMKISLPSEADMHQWQILIDGPKGSPYEVGHHQI